MEIAESDQNKQLVVKETNEQSRCQSCWDWFSRFFIKNFLPISLIFAVAFGALIPAPGVFFNHKETIYVCVSILFCYVGLYLKTSDIQTSLKAYKAYTWGIISVLCVTCVIGGLLTDQLNFRELDIESHNSRNTTNLSNLTKTTEIPSTEDKGVVLGPFECRVGLVLYFIMPCTVGSGVIMLMNLKGDIAVAIMITVVTNIVGIFTIPLYLEWLIYSDVDVQFDVGKMMLKLFLTLFIPLAIGKCLRFITKIRTFISVPSTKNKLKMIAFSALAFILLVKTSQSSHDGGLKQINGLTAVFICVWALTMHLVFILLNTTVSFLLRLPTDQKKTIIILASQKTLSQAVAATVFFLTVSAIKV